MANHVYTTINITGNKEVMEKLEEIKIKVFGQYCLHLDSQDHQF